MPTTRTDTERHWRPVPAPLRLQGALLEGGADIRDVAETKSVTTALYLNNGTEENPEMEFVGKTGAFVPVNRGGGILLREKDGNYSAASAGYR